MNNVTTHVTDNGQSFGVIRPRVAAINCNARGWSMFAAGRRLRRYLSGGPEARRRVRTIRHGSTGLMRNTGA